MPFLIFFTTRSGGRREDWKRSGGDRGARVHGSHSFHHHSHHNHSHHHNHNHHQRMHHHHQNGVDDLIEGRYEIYGSTKSSYSRETTYTLLPADGNTQQSEDLPPPPPEPESETAEETQEEISEPTEAVVVELSPVQVEVVPAEDEDYEDPGYEKIRLAQMAANKKQPEEDPDRYEVVAKVAQEVTLVRGNNVEQAASPPPPPPTEEKELPAPIPEEPEEIIDFAEFDSDMAPDSIEPELPRADEYEIVRLPPKQLPPQIPTPPKLPPKQHPQQDNRRSVVETVNEINRMNELRAAQSLELLSNKLFTKKGAEVNQMEMHHHHHHLQHGGSADPLPSHTSNQQHLVGRGLCRSADELGDAFLEEEFSYEPSHGGFSRQLVLRSRSLASLEGEPQGLSAPPPRRKITTGRDGTFRVGGRAASDLDLAPTCPVPQSNEPRSLIRYLPRPGISLGGLLVNDNIVIIEPQRDIPRTPVNTDKKQSHAKQEEKQGESNTLPRAARPHQPAVQRHFFYRCFKTHQKYVDDDLPDPDKVRCARELFQRVGRTAAPEDTVLMLPIAARPRPRPRPRTTPEVRVVDLPGGENKKQSSGNDQTHADQQHTTTGDAPKWTDTGSQSSGVGSDLSEERESEDEVDGMAEARPVAPEVLRRIRACGTSVTYYGGRVIAHTTGPARSPLTLAILDEIRARPTRFRLVKSNSCGGRLELAPTRDPLRELWGGRPLGEELAEAGLPPAWRPARRARFPDIEFEEFQIVDAQ